jgi:rRNA-processing protein FCF1
MRVILDTSFLLDLVKLKLGLSELRKLLGRCDLVIVDRVLEELGLIGSHVGRRGVLARVALALLEREGVKKLKTGKPSDEAILALAKPGDLVATHDKQLRERLKSLGIRTIRVRKGRLYVD